MAGASAGRRAGAGGLTDAVRGTGVGGRAVRGRVVPVAGVLGVVLLAAALVAAMVFLRFEPANIALAAAAVLVVGAVLLTQEAGQDVHWPRLTGTSRGGYRHEVSHLSWSLTGRDGRLNDRGLRRLRAVARGRLALLGLDLDADAEAVRELLGPGPYATLVPPRPQLPTPRAVSACLTALERLEVPDHPTAPPATTRTPA